MIEFFAITGLINTIVAIALVLYVSAKSPKTTIYWVFVGLSLAFGTWSFGYWLWLSSTEYDQALFWSRILSLGSTLIPLFYLHWVTLLLGIAKKRWALLAFAYLLTIPFLIFGFDTLFVSGVAPVGTFLFWPQPGPLYHLYIIVAYIGFFGYGSWLLWKHYQKRRGQMRLRIKYIFSGIVLAVIGGFTNFPAWYGIPLSPYGNVVTPFFFIACAYAMVQYRLRDIRRVITFAFVHVLLGGAVTVAVAILSWHFIVPNLQPILQIGFIAGLSGIVYELLRHFLHKVTGAVTSAEIKKREDAVRDVAQKLPHIIDYKEVIDLIIDTIKERMQLERTGVLLRDGSKLSSHYKIARVSGFDEGNGIGLVRDNFLTQYLARTHKPLVKEELDLLIHQVKTEKERQGITSLKKHMTQIEAALCLPLIGKEGLIGIIVLGPKISGEAFTHEDLDLLRILSDQAAIAIENAQLYKEVQDFNQTLQKKVDEQTNEIAEHADHLEKLLSMRSEFLDVASHQLRTPVSVITGILSMVRDGDLEALDEREKKKFIDSAYQKGLKLNNIINDILRASEMDTATFTLPTVQDGQIEDIIKAVVEDKKLEAENKKLKLVYQLPETALPFLSLDQEFMTQALTNLVDNAIKYSGTGTITVGAKREDNHLLLYVKDKGIGIPEKDLPKLFRKFARAKNAKEMYTDGSGLGLFIVKQVVEAHGGMVWVESVEDEGSTFYVKLPIKGYIKKSRNK